MKNLTFAGKVLIVVIISALAVVGISYAKVLLTVPGDMVLIEGEEYTYNLGSIFPISIKADTEGILKINGEETGNPYNHVGIYKPVSLGSDKRGKVRLDLKLFGIMPVKTVNVDIVSNRTIVACGNTVGVRLNLDGILVIGVSEVEHNRKKIVPIKNTGIKPGHIITHVNGKRVDNIDELVGFIDKSGGRPLRIKYNTGKGYVEATVTPVISSDDNKYHIGIWVRDSTAGIGTLTYYDPVTGGFGALGHGITDIDTGTLMAVKSGEIMESNILGIKAGRAGNPGELKGIFTEGTRLGVIHKNSDIGIYGKLDKNAEKRIPGKLYKVGVRTEIAEGPATILSNIDGKKIEEYSIEIQKISRQNINGSKGMIIKITDERLLNATGGIVQGMSGSPIIQKGKIIGAVTHVLVNDPTHGYGIFIETMLKNSLI